MGIGPYRLLIHLEGIHVLLLGEVQAILLKSLIRPMHQIHLQLLPADLANQLCRSTQIKHLRPLFMQVLIPRRLKLLLLVLRHHIPGLAQLLYKYLLENALLRVRVEILRRDADVLTLQRHLRLHIPHRPSPSLPLLINLPLLTSTHALSTRIIHLLLIWLKTHFIIINEERAKSLVIFMNIPIQIKSKINRF